MPVLPQAAAGMVLRGDGKWVIPIIYRRKVLVKDGVVISEIEPWTEAELGAFPSNYKQEKPKDENKNNNA